MVAAVVLPFVLPSVAVQGFFLLVALLAAISAGWRLTSFLRVVSPYLVLAALMTYFVMRAGMQLPRVPVRLEAEPMGQAAYQVLRVMVVLLTTFSVVRSITPQELAADLRRLGVPWLLCTSLANLASRMKDLGNVVEPIKFALWSRGLQRRPTVRQRVRYGLFPAFTLSLMLWEERTTLTHGIFPDGEPSERSSAFAPYPPGINVVFQLSLIALPIALYLLDVYVQL